MRIHKVLLSFFIPLCFINLSVIINEVTSHCLGHQQFLLLHLKDNLIFNFATSKKLVHWNQTGDCCQWNGVTCNNGQVISLDLSEEYISGGLNHSSLFNLEYLQNLNLAFNKFGSPIPSNFHKLKNLRHLNLSHAGFEGQIPAEISQLTKLATLDLSSSVTSQNILILKKPDIGMFVQNLTQITKLYLDGVRVSAGEKQWSHALSSSLKNLQELSMTSCNLSGPIDYSISKLQYLSVIRLNQNNMSSPVPKSFANLTNLTVLQLSNCGLIGVFPKEIFQVKTLKVLDISDNQDLQGSLPKFTQKGYLHTLNLSYTNLSGQLPSSISNLKHLSILDLSTCQFNGTLPTSLSRVSQLVHLDLSFNHFNGSLPCFNMSKNLEYLSIFNNDFSGVISSTHWEGLLKLESINLGDNFLTGRVPSSLFTLPSLQELTLSENNFFGFLEHFPNAFSPALQVIDLSKNKLQGPIPVSLFELTKLKFLQLSSNQFNGTMQLDLLRRLQHLHTFGLSHNNVNVDATSNDDDGLPSFPSLINIMLGSCNLREFPGFLRNQSRLLYIDLSNNHIQGVVPNWMWRFDSMIHLNLSKNFLTDLEGPFANFSSNLFSVDLHSNQIHGMAPIFMPYIVYMDYSSNRFSLLPTDIGKHISFLSLANNSFHGKIHESFCNPSNLIMLDLSHNNFIGSIDDCLKNMSSNLKVLSLAGNNLTGLVSDAFSSSCKLRFFDLNGNLFDGVIPKSLSNCQSLEVLNLGNNLLSDRFPCFLKDNPSLRVLILRSNKLHGPIGCTNSTGNSSVLHIVDLASNNFNGTIPGTLLKSWSAMTGYKDAHKKTGNLFVDTNYLHHSTQFKELQLIIDKVLQQQLAKIVAPLSYSENDHIFHYIVKTDLLNSDSYMDSITIVSKGLQMKLVKILSVFTYLDLSFNHFEGPIPQEVMSLRALNVLNLSHNSLSSHIPSSLGDLTQLESLDLSYNTLSGEIPTEITSLSFLSVLNLSFNHLVGKIPTGTQIQSFESYSFEGNKGLCGAPLTKNCGVQGSSLPPPIPSVAHSSIEWNFISIEFGFIFGFGCVIFPLIFWKRWRLWYNKHVDDLLCRMIPQLDFVYEQSGQHKYRALRWRPI